MKGLRKLSVFASAVFIAVAGLARADSVSSIVVFGDSLSDKGNLYFVTGQPPAPYYPGRASNGPVAVEALAEHLPLYLIDFAWGGATSGAGNVLDGGTPATLKFLPGMTTQFNATKGLLGWFNRGVFVVWGGSNDFAGPAPGDSIPQGVTDRAVDNIVSIVKGLQQIQAEYILVPGPIDAGLLPYFREQGPAVAAQATAFSDGFNKLLRSRVQSMDHVLYFDVTSLFRSIVNNPSAYGLTDVTDRCWNGTVVCTSPSTHLFWDDIHPSAAGHAILAKAFAAELCRHPRPFSSFEGCEEH